MGISQAADSIIVSNVAVQTSQMLVCVSQDGQKNEREVDNSDDAAMANQKRMNADPLEVMLSNMGYRITNVLDDDGSGEREGGEGSAVGCRAS